MALQNPSNLYSGYAQVFNEAPHAAFRARLLAQHQAKMDALDEYYRKLPLTINEKGVRDQERPDINKSMLGLKSYYIQNKDKIRKGDGAAAFNYEKMIRDHQDLVAQSQVAGLVDTQVGKLKFNPSVQYMFQSPETIEQLAAHHLPISDPNHVDFDLETFTAPPKPLDPNTYMKRFDKLQFNKEVSKVSNGDGSETITTTPVPSKEALDFMRSNAAVDYIHNPSFTKAIDELGAADSSNPLNKAFKQYYGRDIENPIDVATAYIAANRIPQPSTEKIQTDKMAMENLKDKRFYEHYRFRLDHPLPNNVAILSQATGNALDGLDDADFDTFKVQGGVFYNKDGTPKNGNVFITGDKIPTDVKSVLKASGIDPDLLIKGVDAKVVNGVVQSISNKFIGTATRNSFSGVFQKKFDTEPLKGSPLQFSNPQKASPTKNNKRPPLSSFGK